MHMHARKKHASNGQSITSQYNCTVFCARDGKYAHDYSHGNNLHAPKHEVNAFTENMHAMVNV